MINEIMTSEGIYKKDILGKKVTLPQGHKFISAGDQAVDYFDYRFNTSGENFTTDKIIDNLIIQAIFKDYKGNIYWRVGTSWNDNYNYEVVVKQDFSIISGGGK